MNYQIIRNQRKDASFEDPNLKCDCGAVTSYYLRENSKLLCKTCLTQRIEDLDRVRLNDIKKLKVEDRDF